MSGTLDDIKVGGAYCFAWAVNNVTIHDVFQFMLTVATLIYIVIKIWKSVKGEKAED